MVERTNRRDLIIEEASRLFVEQGYAATSVRQIAEAVGCTEAALYYHFKDGKRELLQAVVECNIPDLIQAVEECSAAPSLQSFTRCFLRRIANTAHLHMVSQLRWIITEFPNLTDEERQPIYDKHSIFRNALKKQIMQYVPDETEAGHLAWLLAFAAFGYGQLMINLNLQAVAEFDLEPFIEFLARQLAVGHE